MATLHFSNQFIHELSFIILRISISQFENYLFIYTNIPRLNVMTPPTRVKPNIVYTYRVYVLPQQQVESKLTTHSTGLK